MTECGRYLGQEGRSKLIAVGGHLFIMSGDLSRLACDAWLLPNGR